MKQNIKRIIVVACAIGLLMPIVASAHDGHHHPEEGDDRDGLSSKIISQLEASKQRIAEALKSSLSVRQRIDDQRKTLEQRAESVKTEVTQRLTAKKRKVCETRQEKVNAAMSTIDERRQDSFTRINNIFDSVQSFYMKHELHLEGFEQLVATANTAKAAAEASNAAQQSVPPLDCSGEHPKADLSDFKQKRADNIDALRNYRDAVKQLVVAVRAALESSNAS